MKFNIGDRVYHEGRNQSGTISSYQYCYDDEVVIDFDNGESARVTESLCHLEAETML